MIIQFSGHLLTCRLKSTGAWYKASTETQIQHSSVNTQNKTLTETKTFWQQ